jgi:lipoyl(octanoyl) transferase
MTFETRDLGTMDYLACEAVQRETLENVIAGSLPDTLLLVEHPPVITLGAAFHAENLLRSEEELSRDGILLVKNDRGGDVTFHGPGQLVAYPIFHLDGVGRDIHRWLRLLEEVVIETLTEFGLEGRRFSPHTGVWIGDKKVCAMGVRVRRWVSMHGLALNCNVDLSYFSNIVPCGIADFGVTSMSEAAGRLCRVEDVKPVLVGALRKI